MERQTRQREAIHEAFVDAAGPLSAQEAHAHAAKRVRALGIATVYRNIKSFVEEGMLVAVQLPGESHEVVLYGRCAACA